MIVLVAMLQPHLPLVHKKNYDGSIVESSNWLLEVETKMYPGLQTCYIADSRNDQCDFCVSLAFFVLYHATLVLAWRCVQRGVSVCVA